MGITLQFGSYEEMVAFAKQIVGAPEAKQKDPVVKDKKPEVIQRTEELPEENKTEVPVEEEETKTYTLEEVRAELARLTRSGKQKEVKELLTSFKAKNLSGVNVNDYAALMEKAGAI